MSALPQRSPTFAEVLRLTLEAKLLDVHTSLPGEVLRYDAAAQTVDVQPWIKFPETLEDGSIRFQRPPVIYGVPVNFPGGGGHRATFPIAAGDSVLLSFCESAIDAWLNTGGEINPSALRRHHFQDAVASPGLQPSTSPWTGALTDGSTFGKDGGPQVVARSGSLELGGNASDVPTEQAVHGTTYRTNENTMLTSVVAGLTSLSAQSAAAGAALLTAAPLNAIPIVGGILALAPFIAAATALATIPAGLAPVIAQINVFKALPSLSNVVKVK